MIEISNLRSGQMLEPSAHVDRMPVINPATAETIGTVPIGTAEDVDLAEMGVGREETHGVPKLLDRRMQELEVAGGRVVAQEPERGHEHLPNVVCALLRGAIGLAGERHERINARVQLGVPELVAAS